MNKKRSVLLAVLLVMVMVIATAIPVAAATTATVTVTAVPAFVSISVNGTWPINDLDIAAEETGVLSTGATYYSNSAGSTSAPSSTVLLAECYNVISNTSTVAIDIKADMANFTGGDAMSNTSANSSASGNSFAAWVQGEGNLWASKVPMLTTGSTAFLSSVPALTPKGVVFQLDTQVWDWSSSTTMNSVITLTATAS